MVFIPKHHTNITLEDMLRNRTNGHLNSGVKVLFVYANTAGDPLVPVGLPQMYAVLKQQGHDARLFDTTWYRSPFFDTDVGNIERAMRLSIKSTNPADVGLGFYDENIFDAFERQVADYKPDLIAISALEMTAKLGFALSEHIRDKGYYIPTIVGGEYATTSKGLVFDFDDGARAVDMICVGEGEVPFAILLNELGRTSASAERIREIPGVWIRDQTNHGYSGPMWGRAVVLEDLPIGDIEIFLNPELGGDPKVALKPMYGKWWTSFTVEKARGCHFKCRFCAHDDYHKMYTQNPALRLDLDDPRTKSQFRRDKPVELFIADAQRKRDQYGMDFAYIMDEDAIPPPTHDGLRRIMEFSAAYDAQVGLPFWIETRPETITPEVIAALSDHCLGISVGVESGSPEIRKNVMRRGMRQERITDAFRTLAGKGIPHVSANLIVGTPYVRDGKLYGETRENFFESIELARRIREIYPVVIPVWNLFQPYRGTGLRDDMVGVGLISEDHICGDYRTNSGAIGLEPVMSREALMGLHRTAALYTHFPKRRWHEVRDAETDDETFFGLAKEAARDYFKDNGGPARPNRTSPLEDDYRRGTM